MFMAAVLAEFILHMPKLHNFPNVQLIDLLLVLYIRKNIMKSQS